MFFMTLILGHFLGYSHAVVRCVDHSELLLRSMILLTECIPVSCGGNFRHFDILLYEVFF